MKARYTTALPLLFVALSGHASANGVLEPPTPEVQFARSAEVFTAHATRMELSEDLSTVRISLKVHSVWKGALDPERVINTRWPIDWPSFPVQLGETYLWLLPPPVPKGTSLTYFSGFSVCTGLPPHFGFLRERPVTVLSEPPPCPGRRQDPFRPAASSRGAAAGA
jgi:hypothetical protein